MSADSSKQAPVSASVPSVPVPQSPLGNPANQNNNYNSYPPYPFPYPYLPQQIVNDMVSMVPAQQHANSSAAGPSTTSNMNGKSWFIFSRVCLDFNDIDTLKKCRIAREALDIVVNVASKNVKARVDVLSVWMGAKIVESWNAKGEIVEGLIKSAMKVGRSYVNFYVALRTREL